MNCIQATRIKSGSVTSFFNLDFDVGSMSVTNTMPLKIDTNYRETCRAQDEESTVNYAVRGLSCDKKHIYQGSVFTELMDFGGIGFFGRCRFLDTPSSISPYVWRVYIAMDVFGGPLPYFETPLNAYGRKAKAYYEDPVNAPELHNASPSRSTLILNAWDPETETGFAPTSDQAYIRWGGLAFAFGNNIQRGLEGAVSITEWITDAEEPYWSESNYPFTGIGCRTFTGIENYGD